MLHSKIGCVLALVLMPAGITLDWFVYREFLWELLAARLLCDVGVLAVLGLLYTPFGARHIRVLGIAWALLPCAAISWMIFYTQGVESPYYAGLNLVIIAVSLLMPWTLGEVLATCGITLGMYLLAVTGHAAILSEPLFGNTRDLFNNVYFIALTAAICGTASFFTGRLRFQDWRNRRELNLRNTELAESYRKLSELDRLKSQFFANVSHELRTPLTLIISPLDEILKEGGTSIPVVDEAIKLARDNGLRLLRLINDLLDLVRMDEKGAELKLAPENLTTFVPGIINSASHLAKAKGLILKVEVPEQQVVSAVDTNALEKVLLNLFTNAVKFTPSGGEIDVVLRTDGGNAIIEIKDTGIGIAPADLPRIFDRFGQLDSSSTRKYSGVGIGLALSRDLVEALGGTLNADSKPAHGTTMRVQLPLGGEAATPAKQHDSDALADVHRAARRAMAVEETPADEDLPVVGTGQRTVLLVEDEPDMRRFLVSLLARDFRVVQAADGLKGYELAVREKPDLALLDLMLPGMDGLDLCAKLRQAPGLESLRVVLLTARTDEESRIEALRRGANDFLTKPFSTLEVRTRIANLLRAAELEERLRATNSDLQNTLRTLRETEAQLIQSEKINALGTLSAGLLHEINNPLNYTLTAVDIAKGELQEHPEGLAETLEDIDQGMRRIRNIVSDLRSFAYPEQAGNHAPFKLKSALEIALRLCAHELKDCKLDVQAADLDVLGSQNQVVQVLINLLTNAAKATAKTGRTREISLAACDKSGRAVIAVRDNGVGIAPDALHNVFDPFYTTAEPGQGMGLGLSICHTIVKAHGGEISLQSRQGDWTEVTFDLPLAAGSGAVFAEGTRESGHTRRENGA